MIKIENILDKLSSYNILNNLLPGTIFCYLMDYLLKINLFKKDVIVNLCLFYFLGMIVSRIGSVIVEPLLKKCKFVVFANYEDYIYASKEDSKIEILSETNNLYRSILGLSLALLIVKLYLIIIKKYSYLNTFSPIIIIISIFILFAFAYKKQTKYIKQRIEKSKNEREAL